MTVRTAARGYGSAQRHSVPYGLSSDDVSTLIGAGGQITDAVLGVLPSLQRSQLERLGKRRADLIRRRDQARSQAERAAITSEIQAITAQMEQSMRLAERAMEPVTVVDRPRGVNTGAIVGGALLITGVVGGVIWLARR